MSDDCKSCEQLIDQRDMREDQIDRIAMALRLSEEESTWSNLNDVGERCIERAQELVPPVPGVEAAIEAIPTLEQICEDMPPDHRLAICRLSHTFEVQVSVAENGVWWEKVKHQAPTLRAALDALRGEAKP